MDSAYDIIIIGTGAGGGTLAYALRASGARVLLLERGDWAGRFTRAFTTMSAATPRSMARHCPACAARTLRSLSTKGVSRRPGRFAMKT